jgi:hypothetical protein
MGKKPTSCNPGEKKVRVKLTFDELTTLLPCLYNLPIKTIQKMLNSSHKTLTKANKSLGLPRWPYESIINGESDWSWETVDMKQQEMMPLLDERLSLILQAVSNKSRELWQKNNGKRQRQRQVVKSGTDVETWTEGPNQQQFQPIVCERDARSAPNVETFPEGTSQDQAQPIARERDVDYDGLLADDLDSSLLAALTEDCGFDGLLDTGREPLAPASPSLLEW